MLSLKTSLKMCPNKIISPSFKKKKKKKQHQIIDVKKLQGHTRLLDGQPLSGVGLRCTF